VFATAALAAVAIAGALSSAGLANIAARGAQPPPAQMPVTVTVTEGTSMSVAVSPDGRTLAIDLQGSIWTLPSSGGMATRITDVFSDARQPAWSPDGRSLAFFAYRDGGYGLWMMAPDGTGMRQLTAGPFDDREPIWSHDGTRLAFSSDRGNPLGSDYNIWTLDLATGALAQLTRNAAEDYMPSWSPDDSEIAFASTRDNRRSVWAVHTASGAERVLATATANTDAPSWGPAGQVVYHAAPAGASRLESASGPLTGGENAFPFRASWASPTEFFYVADGKIRKRSLTSPTSTIVPFTAALQVIRPEYTRRKRDFDSTTPRPVLGVVRPVLSPDGKMVAFAAVGDIHVMPIGGKPENLTQDSFLDTDPAWSPDGSQLVYSSDKGGDQLQLWVRDMKTGHSREVTRLKTQPQGATWSPDGRRIAFFAVDAMWRRADISVLTLATGAVTRAHASLAGPGIPTWSPDGKRLAVAMEAPYSRRYREGTIQVLTMPADADVAAETGEDEGPAVNTSDVWYAPVPTLSIDSRGGAGPVWSPDGTQMAAIYEGVLKVWPVTATGEPIGPPRQVTSESAHAPSWAGNSRHILYQSINKLKVVDIQTGDIVEVPFAMTYTPDVAKGRVIVHASTLIDMKSAAPRRDVDIVIENNRIRSVSPHAASRHSAIQNGGGRLVDATNLTVMPGLVEFHTHLGKDYGAAQGRAWLSFGVTTVRDPGNTPYEIVEDREANEAGARPGPRVYGTGYMYEGSRVYYKMGVAISTPAQMEMEMQRAKVLQHDLIKSYVRLPDLQQKRMVEFAHGIGVPVATHEIYPAALVGVDNTEHTAATSRRGYSPKAATLQQSYEDVVQLFGQSGRIFCPMIPNAGSQKLFTDHPALKTDPRFTLYPEWIRRQVAAQPGNGGGRGGGGGATGGQGKMVIDTMRAGALIVAGTDTPNGVSIHGELMSYTLAGMTPYEALKTATVNPAQALNLDAGTIAPGKLADLIIVDGNPLVDIAHTHKVKRVIANGRVFEVGDLVRTPAR
jgi:Tol biopolymer transport system component